MEKITLYGLNKNGGHKLWSIETKDEEIFIEFGQENGKIQLKIESIKGKNIGRSNETTPAQQAELEALSKVAKQKDKGYRENKEELQDLDILPMLSADYTKQGHRIKYPCWGSDKMDGCRALAICEGGKVTLKSRGGKLYDVKHLQGQLSAIMKEGEIWDGELFIKGKYLEEIVSAIKKPNELTPFLGFVVFDVVNNEEFSTRINTIRALTKRVLGTQVQVIDYVNVESEQDMKVHHKDSVARGFEGLMLRNGSGVYESGKRSADSQKYKEFLDEEFEIVAVGEDKNGNAVLCVFDNVAQETFNVTYGDFEQRKYQLENWKEFISKKLTVKFQTRYKDSKLPQFPTGLCIRDYE
ncbi:ATP-dependent DNA ligase [Pseudomonas sp.]|uniref:ATP-dependent DNA ligase n=1 Tax=Pseudomonas sp. TaxID=306 RepID=UPI003FD7F421